MVYVCCSVVYVYSAESELREGVRCSPVTHEGAGYCWCDACVVYEVKRADWQLVFALSCVLHISKNTLCNPLALRYLLERCIVTATRWCGLVIGLVYGWHSAL